VLHRGAGLQGPEWVRLSGGSADTSMVHGRLQTNQELLPRTRGGPGCRGESRAQGADWGEGPLLGQCNRRSFN